MLGRNLGPYLVEAELGSGGMGTVYRAEVVTGAAPLPKGTCVALKVLHPQLLSRPGFFKRFLREAEIGRALVHPNVVRTFECDAALVEGVQHNFLVMEYVAGQTLRQLLAELGRVPEELCRHIGREASRGLSAIHGAGVIHRDLKPENVLITEDHAVKLMDLGIARLVEEAVRLSQTGAFVGSVHYAAPEQFGGVGDLDGRADLHALGVVLYELSAGLHPFPECEITAAIHQILTLQPPRLGEVNPQLTPFFEEVVHTLLRKERDERFSAAGELTEALENAEESDWWRTRIREIRQETRRPLRRVRVSRETSVYGREPELAKLEALFRRARSGEGAVLLIEGEAGIGKSRLADEFVSRLHTSGQDLDFLFGTYPPGGAATAAGALVTAFRTRFGEEDLRATLARRLAKTPSLVVPFEALLRGEPPPGGTPELTRDTVQTAFVHAARSLAGDRPTVILIDDIHFTSGAGRALFSALAHAVPRHRLLLIGTARRGLPQEWLAGLDRLEHFSRLPLGRLGPTEVERLLLDAFQSEEIAASLAPRIAEKSGGNPYFIFEIIQDLRESGALARVEDGRWAATRSIERIQVPTSIRDLLRSRIGALEEEERELVDVAACCGIEFDASLVADSLGIPRVPALRRFAHIEGEHRIVRSVGRRFVFDHHQIQEVLYEAMPEALRDEYHILLGRTLESRMGPEPLDGPTSLEVCRHHIRGGASEGAARHLDAALDHLKAAYRLDAAVELAKDSLAVPGLLVDSKRLSVQIRLLGHLDTLGRRAEEEGLLEEAEELAERIGNPALRARVFAGRGWYLIGVSRYEEAVGSLKEALELAREAADREVEARATQDLGIALFSLGRYEEAREKHERHLELAREIGDLRGEGSARGNLGNVMFVLGRLGDAESHYERWLEMSREAGNRRGEAAATGNLGTIRHLQGQFAEALENHRRNRRLCREIGFRAGEVRATGSIGLALRSVGRYGEAMGEFETYLELSRALGHRPGRVMANLHLAEILADLGEVERSRERLDAARQRVGEIGSPNLEGFFLQTAGCLAEQSGDLRRAELELREALELRRGLDDPAGIAETLGALGRVRLAAGDPGEAIPMLEEALSTSEEQDAAGEVVLTGLWLALSSGADPERAVTRYDSLAHRLAHGDRMTAKLLLWKATGDPRHIEDAHRLLREKLEQTPAESRGAALASVPLHREIESAYAAADPD